MLTFYIQRVKGQLLAIIQHNNSGTEGEIVTVFHIWSDSELLKLILAAHLETVLTVLIC